MWRPHASSDTLSTTSTHSGHSRRGVHSTKSPRRCRGFGFYTPRLIANWIPLRCRALLDATPNLDGLNRALRWALVLARFSTVSLQNSNLPLELRLPMKDTPLRD